MKQSRFTEEQIIGVLREAKTAPIKPISGPNAPIIRVKRKHRPGEIKTNG